MIRDLTNFITYGFWIVWGIEFLFALWWLFDELRYTYLSVNPVVYFCFLWLAVALVLWVAEMPKMALVLVGITAIPLVIMGLYLMLIIIVSIFSGPIRWN